MLLNKQPHSDWNHLDRVLLRAFQVYEDETGPHGLPIWATQTTDPEVRVEIKDSVDLATKEIQEYDERQSKKKTPPRGMNRWAVIVGTDGKPITYGGFARERMLQQRQEITEGSAHDDFENDLMEQGLIEQKPAGGWDLSQYGDALVESGPSE